MNQKLLDAQFREWPDSIVMSDVQMMNLINKAVPRWLENLNPEQWDEGRTFDNVMERRLAFFQYKEVETIRARFQWALSAFSNRSSYPDGFFYTCGKKDGVYQYVGFRYGVEPSEYMSGYSSLTVKRG